MRDVNELPRQPRSRFPKQDHVDVAALAEAKFQSAVRRRLIDSFWNSGPKD